jgi:lipopolysaccharide transport system ATP-binding protein
MTDFVIRANNLGKKFAIKRRRDEDMFREAMMSSARNLWRRGKGLLRGRSALEQSEEFWALQDVNFEIRRGELVSIIGHNGAGKTTLLKILSRITEPTTGRVEINGRVTSLLEVATGFHPELTGRENIFLNGAILGMSRVETRRRFDEIVEFSGVGKFIDTPVKRYSVGMYVRLAFAVAAHLETKRSSTSACRGDAEIGTLPQPHVGVRQRPDSAVRRHFCDSDCVDPPQHRSRGHLTFDGR